MWIWSGNFRPSFGGSGNPWTNLTESTTGKSASTWYHVVATWDGTTGKLYFDGTEVDSYAHSGSHLWATQPFYFAKRETGSPYDGEIDEIRISDNSLSADWIAADYNNQNSPSTFLSYGAHTANPAGATFTPKIIIFD